METTLKPNLTEHTLTEVPQTQNLGSSSGFTVSGLQKTVDQLISRSGTDSATEQSDTQGTPITGAGKAVVVDDEGNVVNDSGVSVGTPVGKEPTDPPEFPFDITSLLNSIEIIQGNLFNANSMYSTAQQIGDFLRSMQEYFTKFPKVTDGDALNLAQSVYNTISTYMANYLNLLYDRQNWVFQQEYNNPISQIRRFMQAGINPAFYFGSLGNSNAGEIGQSQQSGGQMNAQVQSGNPVLEGIEKGVGVATNLMSAASNVAGTVSSLNYNRAQIAHMKKLEPAELANLYAGAYAQEQAGEFSRANIGYQKILTDCATEQNQIAWANLHQAWDIANLVRDTSLDVAQIGADATLGAASIGAKATMGAASIGANATMYSADVNRDNTSQSNRVAGYKAVIDQYYEEVTELGWVEEDSGDIITSENELYGSITASASSKAKAGVGGSGVEAEGGLSATVGGSIKEGTTTTYNNKKYTSKQISYGRIKDYEKFSNAIRAVDGLVKNGSRDPSFNHYMAKGMATVDKYQRKTLRSIALDFAKWCIGYGR